MSSHKFLEQRVAETVAVYKHYDGDRRLYNIMKQAQEQTFRKKQNQISTTEVQHQFMQHQQKFPRWFDVHDGTDKFCLPGLVAADCCLKAKKTFDVPVTVSDDRDMCRILEAVFESSMVIDRLSVACSFDNTTIHVPQKLVLMKHDESGCLIPEYLKHQERPLSPFVIHNVVGGKFYEKDKIVLITNNLLPHTRYLYKDWSQYQFHHSLPTQDKQMRLCFGVVPETVSVMNIQCGDLKVTLYPAVTEEEWQVKPEHVLSVVDTILHFEENK